MSIDVTGKKNDKERQVEPEYKVRGYDDMLLDCRTSIYRAMELVPQLYKSLRLVGKYTHKQAIAKMSNDLGDLPGFSRRTMRRYLPNDIPDIPRRIRPKWPKNSGSNIGPGAELRTTTQSTNAMSALEDEDDISGKFEWRPLTKVKPTPESISILERWKKERDRAWNEYLAKNGGKVEDVPFELVRKKQG